MKMIEWSTSRLVYQEETSASSAPGLALIATIIGGLTIAVVASSYNAGVATLSCQRVETTLVQCQTTRSHFFGLWKKPAESIGVLKGAFVFTEIGTDSDGDDYTVNLLYGLNNKGNKVPLPLDYGNVDQINQFIASPSQTNLILTESYILENTVRIIILLIVIACVLTLFLKGSGVEQVELDKVQGYLRLQSIYRHQSPKILKEIALDQINSVALHEDKDSDGDIAYQAVLNLKQGESLVLKSYHMCEPIEEMVNQLHAFLNNSPNDPV
jgi:hypothetical protein